MIAIAPTDLNWFKYLNNNDSNQQLINFWTPTPWNIRGLKKGDKLYFLLKSPIRKIGGYGHFLFYKNMNIKDAWGNFGFFNGVASYNDFEQRLKKYIYKNNTTYHLPEDYKIGCIALTNPVYFEKSEYFDPNDVGFDFRNQIVKLKYFEKDFTHLNKKYLLESRFTLVKESEIEYQDSRSKKRIEQQDFRQNILKTYNYKCAITQETCLDIIEAAHIQVYINNESNFIQNGIPLRVDFHRLFDKGLITINSKYEVVISTYLNSEYYKKYSDRKINLPEDVEHYPSLEALNYHYVHIFRG